MTLDEAANECAKFGNLIRAFQKVQEVAETLKSLEQGIAERARACDELSARIETARTELDEATAAKAQVLESAKQILATANAQARETAESASADAGRVVAAVQEKVAEGTARVAELDAQAVTFSQAIATAQQELADINQRIEQAKADARQRFGG
jgi:chromosome segregation ATPase